MIRGLAFTVLVLVALLSGCVDRQDGDDVYLRRFAAYRAGDITAIYDVMVPVSAARHDSPLPRAAPAAEGRIVEDALDQARAYARVNNSTAFLVWHAGRIEEEDYFGTTTRTTPLAALSLAKPLAVIAVGRAIALGLIPSLNEPVADFITEWKGTPKSTILIGQLLRMEAGLAPQEFTLDPTSVMNRAYLSPQHDRVLIDEYPLTDLPGTRFAYSNAAAELIAILIERASGRRYERFLSEEVLGPLGALGGSIWLDRPRGTAHSGCCILLPAETWLRLGVLILEDGVWDGRRLLEHDFVVAMTLPSALNPYAAMMGLYVAGVYTPRRGFSGPGQPGPQVLHGAPYLDADLVVFDGNADQVLYVIRSARLVALRMGSAPPKMPEWDNSVIPNLLLRGIDWKGDPPTPQARQ